MQLRTLPTKLMRPAIRVVLAVAATIPLALATLPIHATELQVRDAHAVATVPGQTVAAGYLSVLSSTRAELVSVSSEAASRVEIHETLMKDGIMRMRRIDSLALPAGEWVRLAPRGTHLMLQDLQRPLLAGEQLGIDLVTADSQGRRTVTRIQVPIVRAVPK